MTQPTTVQALKITAISAFMTGGCEIMESV